MFIISQPCSLELCLYKVKRGNFGITVQKYPHTQQHIIHKAPRLYITKIYINSTWSVQCIILSLEYNPYPFIIRTLSGFPDFEVTT